MPPDAPSPPEPATLTREQLLEALDTEIKNLAATQSAAGWNQWAILGALAAVFWAALGSWEKGQFVLLNAALLALVFSYTVDFLSRTLNAVDSSPLPSRPTANRFLSWSRLLGSTRSALLFQAAKSSAYVAIAWSFDSAFLWPIRLLVPLGIAFTLLALGLSLWPECPEFPRENRLVPRWALSFGRIIGGVVEVVTLGGLWATVYFDAQRFTTADVRLGLLASAILYLVGLWVDTRVPATFLRALRALRQSLAYGRIPLTEARDHADLLLIGGTLAQTVQPHVNTLVSKLDRAREAVQQVTQLMEGYSALVQELQQQPERNPEIEAKWAEAKLCPAKVVAALRDAQSRVKDAKSQSEDLAARLALLTRTSGEAPAGIGELLEHAKASIERFEAPLRQVQGTLDELGAKLAPASIPPTPLPPAPSTVSAASSAPQPATATS
jgi:hypothetical protein